MFKKSSSYYSRALVIMSYFSATIFFIPFGVSPPANAEVLEPDFVEVSAPVGQTLLTNNYVEDYPSVLHQVEAEISKEWLAEQQRIADEEAKRLEEKAAAEEAAKLAEEASKTRSNTIPQYSGGGSKDDWLRASGIPESEWPYVDYIVSRESGWNPNATNASSGACGLAQALPCSKIGGAGGYDPVEALRWQYQYVTSRYGGYAQAYDFWLANHYY